MLGVIAKLTIKPGTNADFEATMKALQAKVRSDEPGNKLYALHKTDDVNVYVMLERYDDQAALEDVFHGTQRSKLDLYEGQGFIVLNDPVYEDGVLIPRQVSIFFGDNYVISFHDHKIDIF